MWQASYTQHVIKPNLAYNYLGMGIRLSYSIGLNRSVPIAYSEAAWPGVGKAVVAEMCKRLWWAVIFPFWHMLTSVDVHP
jgi:hypothetical protein